MSVCLSQKEAEVVRTTCEDIRKESAAHKRNFIYVLLTVLGEKPACEHSSMIQSEEYLEKVETGEIYVPIPHLIHNLSLPYEIRISKFNSDILIAKYECYSSPATSLPPESATNTREYHRKWGQHYGYPSEAIDSFVNDECFQYKMENGYEHLAELVSDSTVTINDLDYLSLSPCKLPNTSSGLQQVVELTKNYESSLREFSERYEIEGVRHVLDSIISETLISEKVSSAQVQQDMTHPY